VKNWTATKVIATIGPASNNAKIIDGLLHAGANLFRLNFSHGDFNSHSESIKLIRERAKKSKISVGLIQDLPGPKIRIGDLSSGPVTLKRGDKVTLATGKPKNAEIPINYPKLEKEISVGNDIFIDDGNIRLKVRAIKDRRITCVVEIGGLLQSRKGVNLPGVKLAIKSLTAYDRKCVQFAVNHRIDFIAMSFVRTADDLNDLRKLVQSHRGNQFLIAKIEKKEAVDDIDSILKITDGVMVARGDLGVEVPIEQVPGIQKFLITKCNLAGKPVITATQVLDSMVKNPRPTRAEATDAANAVLDGTDALMLSQETAVGNYPLDSVMVLKSIIREAQKRLIPLCSSTQGSSIFPDSAECVARSVCQTAIDLNIDIIATPTRSGHTARLISRFKPFSKIVAFSRNSITRAHLHLSWGVYPVSVDRKYKFDDLISYIKRNLIRLKMAEPRENIIITAGSPHSHAGMTNLMMVEKL
jgi:pyruvate kinase